MTEKTTGEGKGRQAVKGCKKGKIRTTWREREKRRAVVVRTDI